MYSISPSTLFIGRNVIFLPECHSTNSWMIENLQERIIEGTLLWTTRQTAGIGQRGNSWESEPDKNLTFSILLKPTFLTVIKQFSLNIAICLAITDTITQIIPKKVTIKWPNDIYVENKKICGILINNFLKGNNIEKSVIGIGLNVNQELFSYKNAVSIKTETGKTYDLGDLLERLLENLEKRYLQLKEGGNEVQKQIYYQQMFRFGEEHLYKSGKEFKGSIIGIDQNGKLALHTSEGIKYFDFKEIEYLL